MSTLLDSVNQNLDSNSVNQISRQIGADPSATQRAIAAALPMIFGGMANKAQQPEGEKEINSAVESHVSTPPTPAQSGDRGGLLGKILGAKQAPVEEGVAQASGLDRNQAGKLLMYVAPVIMGVLARRQGQGQAQSNAGGLGSVLQEAQQKAHKDAQGQMPQLGGILGQILGGR